MIVVLPFIKTIWEDFFEDLYLFGRIILFPGMLIFTICLFLIGLFELFLIDPFVFLVTICSKSLTLDDVFDFNW